MPLEGAHDRCIVGIASTCTCIDDDVDGRQFMLVMSKRFADQSLQVIAPNGTADDTGRDRQPKARLRTIIASNENREQRIREASRILIDAIEIRFVMESLRRCERPGESLQVTLQEAIESAEA